MDPFAFVKTYGTTREEYIDGTYSILSKRKYTNYTVLGEIRENANKEYKFDDLVKTNLYIATYVGGKRTITLNNGKKATINKLSKFDHFEIMQDIQIETKEEGDTRVECYHVFLKTGDYEIILSEKEIRDLY